jgi:hypothetical protein
VLVAASLAAAAQALAALPGTWIAALVAVAASIALAAVIAGAVLSDRLRATTRRRGTGPWWWRLIGAPLDAHAARERIVDALWGLIRGAAPLAPPDRRELARKYVELLGENQGQPGFRELLLVTHDMDARRDLVFAHLRPQQRSRFFSPRPGDPGARPVEAFDLAGVARDHVLDVLSAALAVPLATEPHLVQFSTEGPWRGEAHRLCDRPESLGRLIEEAAHAGAEQIILVSAAPPPGRAHELSAGRADLRGRAGEQLAAFEAASLRDALEEFTGRFASLFVVRAGHNPLTPLDFGGAYDERSDRTQTLAELVDRGYEDAYRQFIEPIVGAGAEPAEPVQHVNGGSGAPSQL